MATALSTDKTRQPQRWDDTGSIVTDWVASAAETRTDRQHGRCPQDVINDGSWSFDSRCLAVISLSVRLNATKSFEVDVCTHRHVGNVSVDVCDLSGVTTALSLNLSHRWCYWWNPDISPPRTSPPRTFSSLTIIT